MLSADTHPFEGPEKKLEIILFSPQPELRSNSDNCWNRVVKSSRSEIISKMSTEYLDAYLLSESSLLIWADRILMITCGETTLVKALPEILNIVEQRNIMQVFYEQKNFLFPHKQPARFEDELETILKYFPGESCRFGPASGDHINVFCSSHAKSIKQPDATLQVLMHDLHPDKMEIFRSSTTGAEDRIEKRIGLDRVYPYMLKDRHIFSPPGYSVNGIFQADYFTVHVTPQADGSYASFETNIIEKNYYGIISAIISIFNPSRFSVVLTSSMDDLSLSLHSAVADTFPGYQTTDKNRHEFNAGYVATFLNCQIED